MANDLQLQFSDAQMTALKNLLIQQGLLDQSDPSNPKVVDTLSALGDNPPVGLFAPVYNYISSIISGTSVDSDTQFWFSKAGAINSDNRNEPADNYIRGVTQYGLEERGRINNLLTQTFIDSQLQRTSNLIAESVI